MPELHTLLTGLDFGEGPRWHDGRLWFSDFYQHCVSAVTVDGEGAGEREIILEIDDHPSGLGWLPDGRMLVVAMQEKLVLRVETDGTVSEHGDLSGLATGRCNDMVVIGRRQRLRRQLRLRRLRPGHSASTPRSASSGPTAPSSGSPTTSTSRTAA